MAHETHSTDPSYLEGQRLLRRSVNAPIRMVLMYWLGLHDGERPPARQQFDPVDLPSRTLPYLFLLERIPGPGWRLRLAGSHLVDALGRDFTGCELVDEQIPGVSLSRTVRLLNQMAETGLPGHFHGRSTFRFRDNYDDHEQVLLPFRDRETGLIEAVLGAIVYEGLQGAFGPGATW